MKIVHWGDRARECGKRRTQLALSFDCGNVYTTIKTSENFKFVEKKNICLSYGLKICLFCTCFILCGFLLAYWKIETNEMAAWICSAICSSQFATISWLAWHSTGPHTTRAQGQHFCSPPPRFDVGSKETSWANICLVPLSQPLSLSLIICWACLPVWERKRA